MLYLLRALDAFAVVLCLWVLLRLTKKGGRLPPGPRGLPFVGNAFDIPTSQEWKMYAAWQKKYGDISAVTVFGQTIVVVNKLADAINLLEKRGSIYSGRPMLVMGGILSGWGDALSFQTGPRVRDMRRIMHTAMGTNSSIDELAPFEECAVHEFLRRVTAAPSNLHEEIKRTAGRIILKLTYGYDIHEEKDPLVDLVDTAMLQFSEACQPGFWLVDLFPPLRHIPAWFPGALFKKKAALFHATVSSMVETPFQQVKEALSKGTASPSLTITALQQNDHISHDEEKIVKWAAGSMYAGGADTTVSSIYTFYLAMTLYPEIQRKAQEEIDNVIGQDLLPTYEDRGRLPYVEALMWEVLRWHPVVPLGLPHVALQTDEYSGYTFPKETIVIANLWNFLHDEEEYHEPFLFNPERFLAKDDKAPERDPRGICFGFGRRICPGLKLADSSVWLSCCLSLAAFDIRKTVVDGRVLEPVTEFSSGVISHPLEFQCDIKPRSSKLQAIILSNK